MVLTDANYTSSTFFNISIPNGMYVYHNDILQFHVTGSPAHGDKLFEIWDVVNGVRTFAHNFYYLSDAVSASIQVANMSVKGNANFSIVTPYELLPVEPEAQGVMATEAGVPVVALPDPKPTPKPVPPPQPVVGPIIPPFVFGLVPFAPRPWIWRPYTWIEFIKFIPAVFVRQAPRLAPFAVPLITRLLPYAIIISPLFLSGDTPERQPEGPRFPIPPKTTDEKPKFRIKLAHARQVVRSRTWQYLADGTPPPGAKYVHNVVSVKLWVNSEYGPNVKYREKLGILYNSLIPADTFLHLLWEKYSTDEEIVEMADPHSTTILEWIPAESTQGWGESMTRVTLYNDDGQERTQEEVETRRVWFVEANKPVNRPYRVDTKLEARSWANRNYIFDDPRIVKDYASSLDQASFGSFYQDLILQLTAKFNTGDRHRLLLPAFKTGTIKMPDGSPPMGIGMNWNSLEEIPVLVADFPSANL
jgi:hypothetical protein